MCLLRRLTLIVFFFILHHILSRAIHILVQLELWQPVSQISSPCCHLTLTHQHPQCIITLTASALKHH